jgi:hypothetical protein
MSMMSLLTELFQRMMILQRYRAYGALPKITATIFLDVANGRDSNDSMLRRSCLQKEIAALPIRRGQRKRRRWLGRQIY